MLSRRCPLRLAKTEGATPLYPTAEGAALAKAGKAGRRIYDEDYTVLRGLAGEDAPRLAALNAAVSPNTHFEQEVEHTAAAFSLLRNRGKDLRGKRATFGNALNAVRQWRALGLLQTMPGHDYNLARAIAAADPYTRRQLLSGAKVDPYRLSRLLYELGFAADRHIGTAYGAERAKLSGIVGTDPEGNLNAKGEPLPFRMPSSEHARVTAHADAILGKLNRGKTNGKWTRYQLQAAQWTALRGILNAASAVPHGLQVDVAKVLDSLTHAKLADKTSIASVLFGTKDGQRSRAYQRLEAAGMGRILHKVERLWREEKEANPPPPGRVVEHLSEKDRDNLLSLLERLRPAMDARRKAKQIERRKKMRRRKGKKLRFAAMPAPMPALAGPVPMEPQKNPAEEHQEQLRAFSPNVSDLSFEDALARTRSGNHKAFKKIIKHVNEQIGLKAHLEDAIGDWQDGAENSLVQKIDVPVDPQTVDYLAAWYGLLANQKSVLAFTPTHNGLDSVYQVDVPSTDLGSVRDSLSKAGIAFRTLVPGKKGTKVIIYDPKRENRDKVGQWAGRINASIRESYGTGRFIGDDSVDPSRTKARAAYRKVITAYEAAAAKSSGQIRAYKPPVLPHHLRPRKGAEETPLRQARLGNPLRFAGELPKIDPMYDVTIPRDTWTPGAELKRILAAFRTALGHTKEAFQDAYRRSTRPKKIGRKKPLRYSGVQAPAGGVVVRGLFYPGGKWIPSANLEKASYDQYQHVERQRAKKYRRSDGSFDVAAALNSGGART